MEALKKIVHLIMAIFVVELILGFTGKMIIVGGLGIRYWLVILTFFVLYGYMLLHMFKNKVPIFGSKGKTYFSMYSTVDWCAFIFFICFLVWATIVPLLMGTSLDLAQNEALDAIAIFSLYFPISYLIKEKEIDVKFYEKLIKITVFVLATVFVVFYIGQEINMSFAHILFDRIKLLLHGYSEAPGVILGNGYNRVAYSTMVYLLVGVFFFLRTDKKKIYDYVFYYLEIVAIATTVTKSLWYGFGIACAIYIVAFIYHNKSNKVQIKNCALLCFTTVLLLVVVNNTLFNNIISIRLVNSFVSSNVESTEVEEETEKTEEDILMELDMEGSAKSNNIKLEQTKILLNKWKDSWLIGFGFGSYVEGYTRSTASPFSYEMQAPMLMMQTGLIGLLTWVVLFVSQFVYYIQKKITYNKKWTWVFLLCAFGLMVQTNPLLLSFNGMSMVLFISLLPSIDAMEEE